MAYLYLNFFDNLTSGSRNFDDFYTQSLTEQYEGIKRRFGRNAPEDLQKFVAMCCPYSESEYYISMPALDRKIQRKVRRDGSEGSEYINNVVVRPTLHRAYSRIPRPMYRKRYSDRDAPPFPTTYPFSLCRCRLAKRHAR